MQKHSDTPLPDIPSQAAPLINIPRFSLDEYAPLAAGADTMLTSQRPLTFEELDMGWGTAIYSASLPEIKTPSTLVLKGAHDYAMVYLNGRYTEPTGRATRRP